MTDPTQLAVAYYLNGTNFRMSAQTLAESLELDNQGRPTRLTAIPLYFLASHADELLLKAALLKRGFDEASLKKVEVRHNLGALLGEIERIGVPVTRVTLAVVQGLSEQHRTHQLRYIVLVDDGNKTYWPPVADVFAAVDELLMLCRISTHGI